jgi:precorrin-6Y C5,15-methyltransferase (decarboxylating)
VEYSRDDRSTLEDNVAHFDLHNIKIIDHVDDNTMAQCPVPSLVFLVASASTEQELECLLKLNPNINVVIYTLDFKAAASLPDTLHDLGLADVETIQVSVTKLRSNNTFKSDPAPWIITARSRED